MEEDEGAIDDSDLEALEEDEESDEAIAELDAADVADLDDEEAADIGEGDAEDIAEDNEEEFAEAFEPSDAEMEEAIQRFKRWRAKAASRCRAMSKLSWQAFGA